MKRVILGLVLCLGWATAQAPQRLENSSVQYFASAGADKWSGRAPLESLEWQFNLRRPLERLTMPMAMARLREFGQKLKHFLFGQVPVQDWGEQTVLFSALLEGVRDGQFSAEQETAYSQIEVRCLEKP
jgi:hypothetical protein